MRELLEWLFGISPSGRNPWGGGTIIFIRFYLYLKHIFFKKLHFTQILKPYFQNKSTDEYSTTFQIPYLKCDLKRITIYTCYFHSMILEENTNYPDLKGIWNKNLFQI